MTAYLLVFHGSRDPRPAAEARQLARLLAANLGAGVPIETAALELAPLPLREQIARFAAQFPAGSEIEEIKILPLFLLPGVHACEDIPAEVAAARDRCAVPLRLQPHLGSHPGIAEVLARNARVYPQVREWILVSHGSRRTGSDRAVEEIAAGVSRALAKPVAVAYWSQDRDLAVRLKTAADRQAKTVGILPYFLFNGGITEAIAERARGLAADLDLDLVLAAPLGATPDLANLALDLVRNRQIELKPL